MSRLALGALLGAGCAVIACAVMVPLKFPTPEEKRRAVLAAFLNRFVLGFVASNLALPMPGPVSGAIIGLAISSPDAVITRVYGPILGMGTVLGAVSGWIASRFSGS